MPASSERTLTLYDMIRVLRRHRFKMLFWCLLVGGLAAAVLFVFPKRYSSTARLFVRLGRESVSLDPTATTGQTIQVTESRENQINSARDLLKSRVICESVVDKLTPEVVLNGPPGSGSSDQIPIVSTLMGMLPSSDWIISVTPREKAIDKLANAISAEIARNSSVIELSLKAKSPQLAQLLLQEFLRSYEEVYLLANRTSGSQSFFADQAAILKRQMDDALARLRDAKNSSGLVSIAAQQQALQSEIVQVEAGSLTTAAALAASQASVEKLRDSLKKLPGTVPLQQTSGFPNVAADSMRQELFKAQMTLRELEAKLGDEHPSLIVARQQVAKSEDIVAGQAPDRAQSTMAVNPSYQALDLDLRREEAKAASYGAQLETMQTQLAGLNERLQALNGHEVKIAELEREASIAEDNYRRYTESLELARIDQAIEASRISNVNVVQPPSLIERPASPKPKLVAALALVAALGGSFLLAFGCEYLNNSARSAEDIESLTGLPILASIPRSHVQQNVYLQN